MWAQSDPPCVDFGVGDIRSQIVAEWLQIAQRSQWRAYRKLSSLFLMVPSLTPYDLPFPPKWGFHIPQYTRIYISATGDPIHFMFGSRVGFSGTADRTALFTVRTNPRWWTPPSGKISNGHISAGRPIHFMFGYRVGFSGTADPMALFSDSNKFKIAAAAILDNFERPYLRSGSQSTYIAHIARLSLQ